VGILATPLEISFFAIATDFGHYSYIKIRPANFNTEHKNILSNLHVVVTKQYLAIPRKV
jgi:hypothetical protein